MYIRDRVRTRGLSGASLTVKKWQLRSLSSQLMREQNVFEETMKELRKRFATIGWSDKDFQASTRDPHPSMSDTSMWDKSIMCLCNNWKCFNHCCHPYNIWITIHPQVIKSIVYLWKLIWKFAACSGLVNLAMAFLCWGNMENIYGREKNSLI